MFKVFKSKFFLFFNTGHERSILAKKNAAISLCIKGFSILTSLLLVSYSIKLVSADEYGIWLTLSSIIGWFAFFDVGLGNGLKNKLAEANAKLDFKSAKRYISSTYALIFAVSLVLFLLFVFVNFFLDWKSILNTKSNENYSFIAFIVFGSFCLQLLFQLIYSVLTALHKISQVSILSFIGQLTSLLIVIWLGQMSNSSLLNLVLAISLPPVLIQVIATIWLFKTKLRNISPAFKAISRANSKQLLNVGWMFFLIQIGALLLFQTDNIIIIQLFDSKMVTSFNVTYKLFSVISIIFTVLMAPLWASFTDAYAKNDLIWIKRIIRKLNLSILIVSVLSLFLLAVSQYIFRLWLADDVETWTSLSIYMSIYIVLICWMTIQCYFLNGAGKIRLQFYLYILATIVNIPLAIFLGKAIGIEGVVISNIVLVLLISITLYIQVNKILNKEARGIWEG